MSGHHTEDQTSGSSSALPSIHGLLKDELAAFCTDAGQPTYRASQIWQWLHVRRVADWSSMRNVPASLRHELAGAFSISPVNVPASDFSTHEVTKMPVLLSDGEQVEEVIIPAHGRNTVCISTQVGCRFHCAFCASGQAGFTRNLTAGEMVAQVIAAAGLIGDRPTNVVFMGVGEPFDNYDNVLRTVRIMNDSDGMNIGARRITISTCGIVPGIRRLAGERLQVELSVSLHAPNNEIRSRLMPVNRKYRLDELMAACAGYASATNRIVTFEYTLIGGVNDGPDRAAELVKLLSALPCRVNLIPLSPVDEYRGRPPAADATRVFTGVLTAAGINTTLRNSRGCSLHAACGQLRASARR